MGRFYTRKSQEEFVKGLEEINPNLEVLGTYVDNKTPVLMRCKKDGYEWTPKPNDLFAGCGCPLCRNKVVVKGINDIATTSPESLKFFVNKEDAYTHTRGSHARILAKCPDCGFEKTVIIKDLVRRGFKCPICSDGISYPNKFSRAMIQQLPVDNFIPEYHPDWAGKFLYDNYFVYNGKEIILEMDGLFHYVENRFEASRCSLEESQYRDLKKDILAKQHNVELIRIDSRVSTEEYLKTNILSSKLANIIDLSNVDWDKCNELATTSLVKKVCECYEHENIKCDDIAKMFNISRFAFFSYLKIGRQLGWCTQRHHFN